MFFHGLLVVKKRERIVVKIVPAKVRKINAKENEKK